MEDSKVSFSHWYLMMICICLFLIIHSVFVLLSTLSTGIELYKIVVQ